MDVHAHYFPPDYVRQARSLLGDPGVPPDATGFLTSYEPLDADPAFTAGFEERIALMDAANIAMQVLSFSAGNVWHPDQRARAALVARFNDGCIEAMEPYGDRFRLFANVPLPFVDASIAETTRALHLPGFVGVSVCTHSAGIGIDDARWDPLYKHWDELGITVFVHPDGFCAPDVIGGHFMGWALGAPFDDTIAAVKLMISGVLERFPNITWIIPHAGGVLPFLLERVDRIWASYAHLLPEGPPPRDTVQRLLFDVATPAPEAVALTAATFGTERLMMGTDFPFANRHDLAANERVIIDAGISGDAYESVLFANAIARLGLDLPASARTNLPR
ncbi:MAG: amidohydrolase family protein [Acidimicrobiia bacterium]